MFWQNALPLMEKQNVSQTLISQVTGRPFSTVHSWIERKCPPQADDALKIADLLGVSVRYLVTGEDEEGLSPRERELLQVCSLMSESKFSIVLNTARSVREDMRSDSGDGLSTTDSDRGAV